MLHRIRMAMDTGTFVGGKAANMHAKRRAKVITGRGAAFDSLMEKLAHVPKAEADKAEKSWKKSRAKKQAKAKKPGK